MASPTETSLISKLQSSYSTGIHALVSDYLRPFSGLTSSSSKQDQTLIRSLAKRFLSFLNTSFLIIPKRLPEVSKSNEELLLELFQVYKLCLDCLDTVSSQLTPKPFQVHFQRLKLIRYYEECGRFHDAEAGCLQLLERLPLVKKRKGKILPEIDKHGGDDKELSVLIVEIAVNLVKCVAMGRVKNDGHFRRVLQLVEEVRPWLRGLDSNSYEKLHSMLVTHLGKCALNFVTRATFSDTDLVTSLCCTTLSEYMKSPIKDKVYKIASRMCASLFTPHGNKLLLPHGNRLLLIMDILDCVVRECKVEERNTGTKFLELLYYCVNKCVAKNANFCCSFATYVNIIAENYKQVMTPINLILRLYAAGLLLVSCNQKSKAGDHVSSDSAKFECLLRTLLENEKILRSSPPLLGSWHTCNKSSCMSSIFEGQHFGGNRCTQLASDCEASITYLSFYIEALKFLCKPLAKSVNLERKHLVTEKSDAAAMTMLSTVEDAFHVLGQLILSSPSFTFEKDGEGFAGKSETVLDVTLAALTLSIRTNHKLQESTQLLKHVIAVKGIETEVLKYIIACLYDIAVILHRNKQLTEAAKVLKLCCKASWLCIKCHCGSLSEGDLKECVMNALTRSALLLDILYDINDLKIRKKLIDTLENWSTANDLFEKLPAPTPVVKQWVKRECRRVKDVDGRVDSPTLYCLLSSSTELSKRNIGIILEQELTAYEEMSLKYPELCQKMQIKITDILLQDIYITQDSCFQKAQTLVRKGKALRGCGVGGIRDCIQCLSEAIIIMKEISGEMCSKVNPIHHQLGVTYCLRALCTQEAEPYSEQIFEDVKAALELWLSISCVDCYEEGECYALSDSIMVLLYNIIDLLQLKGFMELSSDAYRLLIRMFKLKNVSVEKWLTLLWESRRLSHTLCVSPVNEAFILNSLEEFSEFSTINFWIRNLQGNQSSLLGFQHNFSFLFANSHLNSCDHGSSFQTDITVEEVQKAALKLILNVPFKSHSTFLAGYLYHDLSQRLIANGQLIEALSFAKEAYKLHAQLFHMNFTLVHKQNEEQKIIIFSKNLKDGVNKIGVNRSVAKEVVLFDSISWDLKDSYLSPWKVMQCYLESTLQVGLIYEMMGDGSSAETYIRWGQTISCSLQLPLFTFAFSSLLGRVYVKKRHWDLAEKELQCAKQILNSSTTFCCSKCRLILEVTLYESLGDLCKSKPKTCEGSVSEETAKNWYTLALEKLILSEWRNPLSCPEEGSDATATDAKCAAWKTCSRSIMNGTGEDIMKPVKTVPETKTGTKNRKTKNAIKVIPKEPNIVANENSKVTRSRYRSLQNQHTDISRKSEAHESVEESQVSDSSGMLNQKESVLNQIGCSISSRCAITCVFSKMRCWQCLPAEVVKSGLLNDFINLKWEFVRRKLSMKLLTRVVKCMENPSQVDEGGKILLRSISLLVGRNPFCHRFSSIHLDLFHHLVAKEIPGDVFAIERAEIIHDICWYSLKFYHSKFTRNIFCNLSSIKFKDLASWLMVAFVLAREVPLVLQKVSTLLALMYVVSASSEQFSLSSFSKVLGEDYWSSYFHQASIGTHLTCQFLSHLTGKSKGPYVTGSSCIREGTFNSLRLVPEATTELPKYVNKFMAGLPSTTIINITLLQHEYTSLLQELLPYPRRVQAWMLVSRLSLKTEPVVMLLPLGSILQDDGDLSTVSDASPMSEKLSEDWHCPWGSTVVDDVVPAFKTIFEEKHLYTRSSLQDTAHNRMLCWERRKNLDHRLEKLLRNLEDSLFGSWKCLLLGEWLNCKTFDTIHTNLVNDLRSKCKLDVNEGVLKIILGASKYACEGKTLVSQLCSKKDCFIAKVGYCDEARSGIFFNAANELVPSEVAFELLNEALNVLEVDDSVNREPVILVLDYEVQMLPWESLPILRNQEVYRMPSVSSIYAVLDNDDNHKEQVGRNLAPFPSIDPLDAFYLLNPSGDLVRTQTKFENYFRDQNLEGKAGSSPTVQELACALKSHDLFIYFGHGNGARYIPGKEIQKLKKCAATILMGCSSGSLTLHGSYAPQGIPLSYLLAGSPAIVANLWDVTDIDINRFSKAMLDAWLKERSSHPSECLQCNSLSEEFEAKNLKGGKGRGKRKVSRKNLQELSESSSSSMNNCSHRPKIGAFMGKAREVCAFPFLTGAAPVCYGVPTGIWRKKEQ